MVDPTKQNKMSFGDVKTASRMRDLVEGIAGGVVTRMRPDTRIGNVHHYDAGLLRAWVIFPGETEDNMIQVRCAQDKIPTRSLVQYGVDECDIVRIDGRPGNYWISDFVRGFPRPVGIAAGTLVRYGGILLPDGYLECDGTEASQTAYPELYRAVGSSYGSASAGNFKLPFFHKIYDDVDQITSGLFTAASGWTVTLQNLRVRNSMVYCRVGVQSTNAITLNSTNHADQTAATGTSTFSTLYAPDADTSAGGQGAIRTGVLQSSTSNVNITSGVVASGGTLSGNIAAGEGWTFNFFYPMPDDIAGLNGSRMIIKT
jgi:microcystin-dependent protein